MDKIYLINQLKELSDRFRLGIPEAAIEKAISFSRFKVYSKGEMIARTGDKATAAGVSPKEFVDKTAGEVKRIWTIN